MFVEGSVSRPGTEMSDFFDETWALVRNRVMYESNYRILAALNGISEMRRQRKKNGFRRLTFIGIALWLEVSSW